MFRFSQSTHEPIDRLIDGIVWNMHYVRVWCASAVPYYVSEAPYPIFEVLAKFSSQNFWIFFPDSEVKDFPSYQTYVYYYFSDWKSLCSFKAIELLKKQTQHEIIPSSRARSAEFSRPRPWFVGMVVFICGNCGESVKKAAVDKHCQTKCRNCRTLSCIDCGKDFPGETYRSHNQ